MKDVPADYYARLADIDASHWWTQGMIDIELALLGPRLQNRPALLDAGCGTGGFLVRAAETGCFGALNGVDMSAEAIEIARRRVPGATLEVSPLAQLPFDDGSFGVVVSNDVVQHVHERELGASLAELRRVLRPVGVLAVRTNGGRTARRERDDWRLYDASSLRVELETAGFSVERVTYANALFSAAASARGHSPRAPTVSGSGIPSRPGKASSVVGSATLALETTAVRHRLHVPWGHTLFALAVPR